MKTKLVVIDDIFAIKFNENSFFSTILGFTSGWEYEHYIEDTSQNIVNFSTTIEIHLKKDVIDVSVANGSRQAILYSFVLNKKPGYKVFCEPETVQYKKINRPVLNSITFYSEEYNHQEVDFNGETLTFTLLKIKI